MLKQGRLRAVRNLLIGWITHANHGRDRTERYVHWVCEVIMTIFISGLFLFLCSFSSTTAIVLGLLVTHTLWWIINGNFYVYTLDSFSFIKNAGINSVLNYIQWANSLFLRTKAVECVLVYGSFCRGAFHDRSDLDLRIVRRIGAKGSSLILFMSIYARFVSLCRGIPTDLQVVDSMEFLKRQMREDEHPVVVYCRKGYAVNNPGSAFDDILKNPEGVLRKTF